MPPTVGSGRMKYEQEASPDTLCSPDAGVQNSDRQQRLVQVKLETLFEELSAGFAKLHGLPDAKAQSLLKELTTKMQEAKTCALASVPQKQLFLMCTQGLWALQRLSTGQLAAVVASLRA